MIITFKKCKAEDVPMLYKMTKELIDYHNMLDIFTLTEERLAELVINNSLISYIAFADNKPAGIINCFYKYTTFSGKKILYLEDLYVKSEFRKSGLGKKFFALLEKIAVENDCEKIEWKCADFNESGKRFYDKIGAEKETVWQTYTLDQSKFNI